MITMRWLHVILLITSSQCVLAQRTYNVLLTPTEKDINIYPFYIDSVVDDRPNKSYLGSVALGAFNKPSKAIFENGFEATIQNFLSFACQKGGEQQRIVAFVHELNISEQAYSLAEGGFANLKITYYKRTYDSLAFIGTFSCTEFSKSADATNQHEQRVKKVIINCLEKLSARLTALALLNSNSIDIVMEEDRFKNFHGLKNPQGEDEFFEGEGYEIFVNSLDQGLDEKGLAKIKSQLELTDANLVIDSTLNLQVLASTKILNSISVNLNYYLIPASEKKTLVIGFSRGFKRDINLERKFVMAYRTQTIPFYVFSKLEIDTINFVGRTIKLGPACRWMNPHNIQCPDLGQMNWAIFENLEEAEMHRDLRLALVKQKSLVNLKEEKWINVIFEGQKTQALKLVIKAQIPKVIMGGSNVLNIYYITTVVRGKFVTCVLSHYTDEASPGKLPPLLSEVMQLIN